MAGGRQRSVRWSSACLRAEAAPGGLSRSAEVRDGDGAGRPPIVEGGGLPEPVASGARLRAAPGCAPADTTCLRVPASSLANRFFMCHLIVSSPTCIASPISLLDRLRASSSSTSRSLGVSAMLGVDARPAPRRAGGAAARASGPGRTAPAPASPAQRLARPVAERRMGVVEDAQQAVGLREVDRFAQQAAATSRRSGRAPRRAGRAARCAGGRA